MKTLNCKITEVLPDDQVSESDAVLELSTGIVSKIIEEDLPDVLDTYITYDGEDYPLTSFGSILKLQDAGRNAIADKFRPRIRHF